MRILLLALALLSPSAFAGAPDPHCRDLEVHMPEQRGQLCVYPGERSGDVLYYLHGMNGTADLWGADGFWSQQVRDYWKAKGLATPTVVSISLGQVWLLAPRTQAPGGFGVLDVFVGRLLPSIEAQLGGVRGRRILLGDSMGGFNAIQLGMKTDLFAKVAALCAPMSDGSVGPFSADAAVDAYINASTALRSQHHGFAELKDHFSTIKTVVSAFWTESEWPASDPIQLARALRAPRASQFYLAAGYFDVYLAYEGNAAFAAALAASGTSVEWRPQWGDHCAVDVPSLAEFLVK